MDYSKPGTRPANAVGAQDHATGRLSPDGVRVHPSPELGTELQSLLRRLIDQFASAHPETSGGLPLVVEIEVEGTRCVVIVAPHASPHPTLSPREHEIAQLVGHGLPNKTIAANLGISSWTVSTHLRRMFIKFDVNSRTALVAKILEDEFVL